MPIGSLVGRADELRRLDAALTAASSGAPQIVIVQGEAGFGKSSLLNEFLARHGDQRAVSWIGDATETDLPYGMASQLLATETRWPDPFAAGGAILAHLGDLSGPGPLVLALDDAPLADRPSLDGLNFALRRLRHDPVLVVLSSRASQVDTLPTSILRMASDAGNRISLGGLSADEIVDLARTLGQAGLSLRAAERLSGHTGGSPLHLRALLTEVPIADLERLDRPVPAPHSFAQLVLAGLASAPEPARRVATAAAVLGERVELSQLVALTDLTPDTVLLALDELTLLGVLRLRAGATAAEFAHPLVRAAVYDDLAATARMRLHEGAARLVEGAAALRHRLAATFTADPVLAHDIEDHARAEEVDGNLRGAADLLFQANGITPPGDHAERLLLDAVRLLVISGDVKAAREHQDSLASMPPGGRRLAVEARVAWLSGRAGEAKQLATRAWNCSDLDPQDRDLVAALLAQIEVHADHGEEAARWARLALADDRLDPATASHTRGQLATGLAIAASFDQALSSLDDLPSEPDAVPPERHPELLARGHLRTWTGPQAAAIPDLEVAGRLTHGDMQPFRLTATGGLAIALFRAGDWEGCQANLEASLSLAQDMEQTWITGFLHSQCSWVPAARGHWEPAEHHVSSAQALADLSGDRASLAYAAEAAAHLAMCRSDNRGVLVVTEQVRHAPPGAASRNLGMFWWPVHRITALVNLGRLDEAEAELEAAMSGTRPDDLRCMATLDRVAGQLAAARHDIAFARERFAHAVDRADERVDALERAMALDAFGRFLRRRGERRAAVTQLGLARERYVALRAEPFVQACDAELEACGVRQPTQVTPADPLTPQERVVATLVCSGRTNKEAAAELVVSVKTIGYHLANVHTKLGVHSRAQLIAAMRDLDDHQR